MSYLLPEIDYLRNEYDLLLGIAALFVLMLMGSIFIRAPALMIILLLIVVFAAYVGMEYNSSARQEIMLGYLSLEVPEMAEKYQLRDGNRP